jgi:uncharacterized repeat protein (TIGR01451 family)
MVLIMLTGLLFISAGGHPVSAASLTVNTNSDTGDDNSIAISLAADQTDGAGLSLRESIYWALPGDTVTFTSGLSTIILTNTLEVLGKNITIDGDLDDDNTPDITISGNNACRVFYTTGLSSSAVFNGLIITGGSSLLFGGGMCNYFSSSPTVSNCTFSGNTAVIGGGMFNLDPPTVIHCTFSGNTATVNGGGMNNDELSLPTVTNCTFSGNTANRGGGMYNNGIGSPTVTNCIFSGNTAEIGGGMCNNNGSSATVTNCTFSGNTANPGAGGGMFNNVAFPTLANCILWGDSSPEIFGGDSVNYCDIQGGYAGTGNIDSNPLLVNSGTGDFHLQSGSPCIDSGDNASATAAGLTADFEGDPRIVDGNVDGLAVVDMGADEYLPEANLALSKTASSKSVPTGGELIYTIRVTNNGPDKASGISVAENLPSGVVCLYADTHGEGVYYQDNGTWSGFGLSNGATATLTLVVIVSAVPGTITNSAVVSGEQIDNVTADNTASYTSDVIRALGVGGEVVQADKLAVVMPWLFSILALIIGAAILILYNRQRS